MLPALNWLHGGEWVTSARRGPVYSLFIAAVLKFGGTLRTVTELQALLGILTTFLTVALARCWLGIRSALPLAICSCIYVFYGMPLELEKLVRNETLLAFFATTAFGAWCCALRKGSISWMMTSGLSTGLMQLLKGIFPVFPLIVLGLTVWNWRTRPRRALGLGGTYLLLFLLPLAASKSYNKWSGTTRPPEPEDGQMFLGRTAQWSYLEPGGILPDIKARIHDQAAAYADRFRRTGKLDNNEIVKRTVVPTLKTIIVDERGGTLVDVNRVSWRLGLEAVSHHPGAYARQVLHDLWYLNFVSAQRMTPFDPKTLDGAARDAKIYATSKGNEDPLTQRVFEIERSHEVIHAATKHDALLQRFARFLRGIGRVRFVSPVFITTMLLPWLVYITRGRERLFWIGNVLLWYYYLVLLSTVGRPLDRYLMPVVPIIFWAIATAASHGWRRWLVRPSTFPGSSVV